MQGDSETGKKNKKFRKSIIIVSIIAILILIGFFTLVRSSEIKAFVIPESGVVEVNFGSGFIRIDDETLLSEKDVIRTLEDSTAVVILHESAIITLEPNTEVSLDDLAKSNIVVKQNSGSTWNKFTRLNGLTNYQIQTPSSVATVRGTEFGFEESKIIVADGSVAFAKDDEDILVSKNEKAQFSGGEIKKVPLTSEDKDRILENMRKQIDYLALLREKELEKNKFLVATLEKTVGRGYTAKEFFQMVDNGDIDIDEAIEKSPVPLPFESVKKIRNLSLEIKSQLNKVEEFL